MHCHPGVKSSRELVAQSLTPAESKKPTSGLFFPAQLKISGDNVLWFPLPALLGEQLPCPCQHIPPLGAAFPQLPAAECDTMPATPLSAAQKISAAGVPGGQSC